MVLQSPSRSENERFHSPELVKEFHPVRDIFNDPNVVIEGTELIITTSSGIKIRRSMKIEELKQLRDKTISSSMARYASLSKMENFIAKE